MNRVARLFAAALLAAVTMPASVLAHDFKVGDLYYSKVPYKTGVVMVTYKGNGYPKKSSYPKLQAVNIPQSITVKGRTYAVTGIDDYAFKDCRNLIYVGLSEGLEFIGNNAFERCGSMKRIELPGSLHSLGNYAFAYSGLEKITIPAAAASLGTGIFANCRDLREVEFESDSEMLTIRESMFLGCRKLNNINTNDRMVREICSRAFYECDSLAVLSISDELFKKCTKIGDSAFYGCDSYIALTWSNNLTEIGNSAFANCPNIKRAFIPKSVTKVGGGAFSGCSGLKEIWLSYKTYVAGTTLAGDFSSVGKSASIDGIKAHLYEDVTVANGNDGKMLREICRLHYKRVRGKEADEVIVCIFPNASVCAYLANSITQAVDVTTYDYIPSSNRVHLHDEDNNVSLRITPDSFKISYGPFDELYSAFSDESETNKAAIKTMATFFSFKETEDPEDDWWDWLF